MSSELRDVSDPLRRGGEQHDWGSTLGDFDAILFDAGGVLILPDTAVFAALLAPLGGSALPADHRRAHYAAMKAKSDLGASEKQWSSYQEAYAACVGVAAQDMDVAVELMSIVSLPLLWREPIPASVAVLAALAERGVPMGVVSNASGQVEAELARLEICQVGPGPGTQMRVIVDSDVVGVAKPDPQIFDFALEYFREFERSRILYVGDSVAMDINGATAAGLPAVLIDPYDDHPNARFPRIANLVELL